MTRGGHNVKVGRNAELIRYWEESEKPLAWFLERYKISKARLYQLVEGHRRSRLVLLGLRSR